MVIIPIIAVYPRDDTFIECMLEMSRTTIITVFARELNGSEDAFVFRTSATSVNQTLHIEARTGEISQETIDGDAGNAKTEDILSMLITECPDLRSLPFALDISCSLVWGHAEHRP